jgi:hypothetical protein
MLWNILIQVDPADGGRHSPLFVWINTHSLSNTAFNISPFFASAIYASPNVHYAFFFSLTEIVYQTHCSSFLRECFLATVRLDAPQPVITMPIQEGWKLLASSSHFVSLRSKPL